MTFVNYNDQLKSFPSDFSTAFNTVGGVMAELVSEEDYQTWAEAGFTIARRAGRSWEAARDYIVASPRMAEVLQFNYFKQWSYWGTVISEESPVVGGAYFRSGPGVAKILKPWDIAEWAQLGKSLSTGARHSDTLTANFFEASADLLQVLSFSELKQVVVLVEGVAEKSAEEAIVLLSLARDVVPSLREDVRACLSLVSTLVKEDWRQARGCLEVVKEALPRIERLERAKFLALASKIVEGGAVDTPLFLRKGAVALGQVEGHLHAQILGMADAIANANCSVVPDFIDGVPFVLRRVSVNQLESWYNEGLLILEENPDAGVAFFKRESARSEEVLERLSMGVELSRIKETLRLYCRALSDMDVEIASPTGDAARGKGWVSLERVMEEGATIYLPQVSENFKSKEHNYDWYKVVATHQTAHLEFQSFRFSFGRSAAVFSNMRYDLVSLEEWENTAEDEEDNEAERILAQADLQRFFTLFEDGILARDIFTAVEDCRLDYRVKKEYPGIRSAYAMVQGQSLDGRPPIEDLPAQEAMVELLIRFSLQQGQELMVPEKYSEWAKALWGVVQPLSSSQALVEDSAEAVIRLYQLISQIPNEDLSDQSWDEGIFQDQSWGEGEDDGEGDDQQQEESWEEVLKRLAESQPVAQEGESRPYQSPPNVDFRGEFKPELMQLMSLLKDTQRERGATGETMSKEDMERLLAEANEMSFSADRGELKRGGAFVSDLVKEIGSKGAPEGAIRETAFAYDPLLDEEEQGGPLEVKEPAAFLYDEWDYRISDYRPRWCLLREKVMAEGDASYFGSTLDSYSVLAAQIRRQFELMVPQGFRKMRKQQDGDELELDSVIEALVDKRSGITPSEKVYLRRNKVERDVAVVFLMDMSASTAEAIDETRRVADEWDAPDDPLEYMFWLRSRRGEGIRRSYKRIVDLEKESLVLLIHALETIGDTYGIYGFSGYGRENVDFFVIKDVKEALNDVVKRRIEKVAPLQATRMGPAIRHAITKLEKQEARTKFLFLISDGRPQDRGYSREGVEKEYAIYDTREALNEARQKGITPFCLTVDKEGHDYMRSMAHDMNYEVLADISTLPKRLPALYRDLTV